MDRDIQELVSERGRFYWIDSEGERVSPCFDDEPEAWAWFDNTQ